MILRRYTDRPSTYSHTLPVASAALDESPHELLELPVHNPADHGVERGTRTASAFESKKRVGATRVALPRSARTRFRSERHYSKLQGSLRHETTSGWSPSAIRA